MKKKLLCHAAKKKKRREIARERERKKKRDSKIDRGAIWLDAHHFHTRYFLFITQLILCDKVTTVYRSMVASGWLVFGGAGGSGVCRVFLYIFCIFLVFLSFFFLCTLRSLSWRKRERERGTKGRRCEFRTQRLEVTDNEGTCSDGASVLQRCTLYSRGFTQIESRGSCLASVKVTVARAEADTDSNLDALQS